MAVQITICQLFSVIRLSKHNSVQLNIIADTLKYIANGEIAIILTKKMCSKEISLRNDT